MCGMYRSRCYCVSKTLVVAEQEIGHYTYVLTVKSACISISTMIVATIIIIIGTGIYYKSNTSTWYQ